MYRVYMNNQFVNSFSSYIDAMNLVEELERKFPSAVIVVRS